MRVVTPEQYKDGYFHVLNPHQWAKIGGDIVYVEKEWVLLAELDDGNYLVEEQK